ncbi:MAG TPA: 1,4-dihydroxy-6-naphthoate synthase [Bacteroidales bacterium]|nr:1,4-dihydroxy-6-naphthoate synthase [Bacteroidales bacterium]
MLSLAISTCPNDTFIFDAIINHRIDLEGLRFDPHFHDVQQLNEIAMAGMADMIKVSFYTYLMLQQNFVLLDAGSALGFGNGPLVIAREECSVSDLAGMTIALPGKFTTAHMLFNIAVPGAVRKEFMVFHEIEEAVLSGRVDAGVIIHENRFTYEEKGLKKVLDLGNYWEQITGSPIPLGGIIARKGLGYNTINKLNRIMHRSVKHAFQHPELAMPFVRKHAQEMDDAVMEKHIHLYVNENTLSLGTGGKVALAKLQQAAIERGLIQ